MYQNASKHCFRIVWCAVVYIKNMMSNILLISPIQKRVEDVRMTSDTPSLSVMDLHSSLFTNVSSLDLSISLVPLVYQGLR